MNNIRVGIVTPSSETAESLQREIAATGMAIIVGQSMEYASTRSDWSARSLIEEDPDVIILEIRETAPAVRCLQILHAALPNTRLLVASSYTDPQLIIEAMQSGAREFLPLPATQAHLLQALTRHVAERERNTNKDQARRGRLYCTISAKRGSGATTVALNLAGMIAEETKAKVALLDLDQPVGDAAAYLNLKPAFNVSDAVEAAHRLDSVLLESFLTPTNGFQLLAGFRDYSSRNQIGTDALSQILDVAARTFAHTVIDLPECLTEEQVQVIASMSSAILVVVTPDVPSIWRTERLLNSMAELNVPGKIKIVLNRQNRSNEISETDIEKLLKHSIYVRVPNDYNACMRAINSGRLLNAGEGKHVVRALRELAQQLAGMAPPEPRRGLFGLFLKPSSVGGSTHA